MYNCKILLDSISETGKRITTFEITFPRIVLAEFNTHRMFSRNSASSRAIPFSTQLDKVDRNPFIPERFPINGKGMQPDSYIEKTDPNYNIAVNYWLNARDEATRTATNLYNCLPDAEITRNIHKQICNRILEPFMWHTVICTATEFDNFFKLRTHSDAQYEIRRIADLMYEAYHAWDDVNLDITSSSYKAINNYNDNEKDEGRIKRLEHLRWSAVRHQKLKVGEWHTPLVYAEDEGAINDYANFIIDSMPIPLEKHLDRGIVLARNFIEIKKKISVARCARVSYLTHDGKRDIEKDLELFEKLRTSGHWSPFEHVATPYFIDEAKASNNDEWKLHHYKNDGLADHKGNLPCGNFRGWKQYRKEFADENCTSFRKEN